MSEKVFYITKEKLGELKREYEKLVDFEHTKVVGQEAPKILQSEDVNSEFISFQEDMDALRLRIDEVKDILENYEIIKKPSKEKQVFVSLGASVKVDINGKSDEFKIVGTLEVNPNLGHISNESPVGKALLGHRVGDKVVVVSHEKTVYKIKDIKYEVS